MENTMIQNQIGNNFFCKDAVAYKDYRSTKAQEDRLLQSTRSYKADLTCKKTGT